MAGRGQARLGGAWRGEARPGEVRRGKARPGKAWVRMNINKEKQRENLQNQHYRNSTSAHAQ